MSEQGNKIPQEAQEFVAPTTGEANPDEKNESEIIPEFDFY